MTMWPFPKYCPRCRSLGERVRCESIGKIKRSLCTFHYWIELRIGESFDEFVTERSSELARDGWGTMRATRPEDWEALFLVEERFPPAALHAHGDLGPPV